MFSFLDDLILGLETELHLFVTFFEAAKGVGLDESRLGVTELPSGLVDLPAFAMTLKESLVGLDDVPDYLGKLFDDSSLGVVDKRLKLLDTVGFDDFVIDILSAPTMACLLRSGNFEWESLHESHIHESQSLQYCLASTFTPSV